MNALFNMDGQLCGSETNRRAALCRECMSAHCAFNPEGICVFPLVYGRTAEVREDAGCLDWLNARETEENDV